MAFIGQENLIAKITPSGKRKLINNNIETLIKKFALGDSDANYKTTYKTDLVADVSGNENTTFYQVDITNKILYNSEGYFKNFSDSERYMISNIREDKFEFNEEINIIKVNAEGNGAEQNILKTINAPITKNERDLYEYGILSKNAYGSLKADDYIVIPFSYQGDIIDGNDIKIVVSHEDTTYELFSSLPQGTSEPDKTIFDDSRLALSINKNMVPLFCDEIARPIENEEFSWSDGHGVKKPYSNGKKLFDVFTSKDLTFGDKMVGYVLLDKGLIVLTNETIVQSFDKTETLNVEIDGDVLIDYLAFEVVCHINRNEFISSMNSTYNTGDAIRISEVGLYDEYDDLIAIAKIGEQVVLDRTKPVSLSISITF